MVYKNKGRLEQEQDAPTAIHNKNHDSTTTEKCSHLPSPLLPHSPTPSLAQNMSQ
ncbi:MULTISPECIES: hypothetical protein [unclassified Okeania]|uniref:hypothetical protein n=1 Tax=unclassified Okeania TaxID=2634635 RepID=UPI0013BC8CA9|nr:MULTISPECIES: hypothetical protein [unclassified Okeania]NET15187.1 hypothetical protein [Okeania sp. SIO1H6]NET18138.1 hypothetical protein [Okeania sp. SIO1H5]NET93964.1 hypothetical protein [Okeania sp. SIO1H2]